MADIAPMLGAILGVAHTKKGKGKKAAAKSKKEPTITHASISVNSPSVPMDHKMPTDKHMIRENAKREMRHATDSWVSGHTTTKEHAAIHARAAHVLSGKRPMDFKGTSGERKMKLR